MRRRRDEAFRLVMTAAEKAALETLTESEDGSQAAIIRRLIRAEAQRWGLWPVVREEATPTESGVRA